MGWLVIIGLVVAVVKLWDRVGKLERELRELEPATPAAAAPIVSDEPEIIHSAPVLPAEDDAPAPPSPLADISPLVPSWKPVAAAAPIPLEAEEQLAERSEETAAGSGFL
ncbi:MAG TPA: hypothetical protein VI168_17895, partial [Croceibacterium sp.]